MRSTNFRRLALGLPYNWSKKHLQWPTQQQISYTTDALDGSIRSAFSYCVNLVRTNDYENYLWCTQLPKDQRAALMALRAFNIETAMVADHSKEPAIVQMRFQWWRDEINSCYKGLPAQQPVLQALSTVLSVRHLTRYRLQRILQAREEDALRGRDPPPTLAELEGYAENTTGQLLHLQLEAAGVESSEDLEHVLSHAGKGVGVASILRGTTFFAQRGHVYLPWELLRKHNVSPTQLLKGQSSEALRDCVLEVASLAKAHVDEACSMQPLVPPSARPLFLPLVASRLYLTALEQHGFDPFSPKLARGGFTPLWHHLLLKYHLVRGTYC